MAKCPCVVWTTRQAALKELGIEDPRPVWQFVRDLALRWYAVEKLTELEDDVAQTLTQLWRDMNAPVYAKIEELKWKAKPDCWLCCGTGEYNERNIEYATETS